MRAGSASFTLLALLGLIGWAPSTWARCQGQINGPCSSPEPVAFLADPSPVVVTNFGLLYPATPAGDWQLVCDDLYGLALPAGIRRASDGRLFAAAGDGLRFSSDGCTWSQAGGAAAGQGILDVAVGPSAGRVWALTEQPPALLRSDDGGARFDLVHSFDPGQPLPFHRLVATADGQRLYLFGRGSNSATPATVSVDGGQTFTTFDLSTRGPAPPPSPLDFLAVSPDDPQVLYFQVFDPQGDQLWRTTDGGQSVTPILQLGRGENLGGFSFGASTRILYVGALNPFPEGGVAPGHLHVSRDSGASWEAPLPSPLTGPRYRCLSHADSKLYACGAGETLGDAFLVGVSTDDGRTWQPHTRLRDVAGARSCVKSRCLATEVWLCQLFGQCSPDGGADALPSPDAASATPRSSGCSCTLGGRAAPGLFPALVAGLLLVWRRSRPRARRP